MPKVDTVENIANMKKKKQSKLTMKQKNTSDPLFPLGLVLVVIGLFFNLVPFTLTGLYFLWLIKSDNHEKE